MAEDKKGVQVLLKTGGSIQVVTRMPRSALEHELFYSGPWDNGIGPDPNWIKLYGLAGPTEEPIEIMLERTSLLGAIIGKFEQRHIQPVSPKIIQ